MIVDIVKILAPAAIAFVIGIIVTFPLTGFLYRREMWKKKAKTVAFDGSGTPIFNKLHAEREVKVPKMGGAVIWLSAFLTVLLLWFLAKFTPFQIFDKLDFFSRDQTWIPMLALAVGAAVGLADDYMDVRGSADYVAGGLSLKKRLLLVGAVSLAAALWFYFKLDVSGINLPFAGGELYLGAAFIPFFVAVSLAVYSGGIIDGLDGLAGGIFAAIFSAYAGIAFYQNQINLAAFCAVIVGGILAFLWFNIPPARFYMSETGTMSLTLALSMVVFMTDSLGDGYGVSVLPIIGLPLFVTAMSVIVQILSKRFRHRKVFLVAPLHHHFEAVGWPAAKVTMRYWVIGVVCAVIGLIVAMLS